MEEIKKGKKISPEERDKILRRLEIGPYRKWTLDINRIKEIDLKIQEQNKISFGGKRGPYSRGSYSGKKQRAKELQRLKAEIENG